jgi:ferric-dicitrate binding protein FerR (iron transport regulator)
VEITGEAYFEVMHDARKPFMVTRGTTRIEVLGTHFNVNAYDDEQNIKVTLLEGQVKVQEKQSAVILQPGEQAIAPNGNVIQRLSKHGNIDIDAVMAWKNGLFAFNDADVPTIMRQLARWYDVDVRYEGAIPARTINGKIGQSLSLDQVLRVLTKLRIHYTIDGKNLTVRP